MSDWKGGKFPTGKGGKAREETIRGIVHEAATGRKQGKKRKKREESRTHPSSYRAQQKAKEGSYAPRKTKKRAYGAPMGEKIVD